MQTCSEFNTMIEYWLNCPKSEPGLVEEIWQHMTADCPVCMANRNEIAEYRESLQKESVPA